MRIWFAFGALFVFAGADQVDPLTDKDHFKVSLLVILFIHPQFLEFQGPI